MMNGRDRALEVLNRLRFPDGKFSAVEAPDHEYGEQGSPLLGIAYGDRAVAYRFWDAMDDPERAGRFVRGLLLLLYRKPVRAPV